MQNFKKLYFYLFLFCPLVSLGTENQNLNQATKLASEVLNREEVKKVESEYNDECLSTDHLDECDNFSKSAEESEKKINEQIKCLMAQRKELGLPENLPIREVSAIIQNEIEKNPNYYRFHIAKEIQKKFQDLSSRFTPKGIKTFETLKDRLIRNAEKYVESLKNYQESRGNVVNSITLRVGVEKFSGDDPFITNIKILQDEFFKSYSELESSVYDKTKLLPSEKELLIVDFNNFKNSVNKHARKVHDSTIKSLNSQIETLKTTRDIAALTAIILVSGGTISTIAPSAGTIQSSSVALKVKIATSAAVLGQSTNSTTKLALANAQSGIFATIQLVQGKNFMCEFSKHYNQNFSELNDEENSQFLYGVSKRMLTAGISDFISELPTDGETITEIAKTAGETYQEYKDFKAFYTQVKNAANASTEVIESLSVIKKAYSTCLDKDEVLAKELADIGAASKKLMDAKEKLSK